MNRRRLSVLASGRVARLRRHGNRRRSQRRVRRIRPRRGRTAARGRGPATRSLFPAEPYTIVKQTWADAPRVPRRDGIDLTLTDISAVTILTTRAHVDCNARIHVITDGPVVVHLAGRHRDVHAG